MTGEREACSSLLFANWHCQSPLLSPLLSQGSRVELFSLLVRRRGEKRRETERERRESPLFLFRLILLTSWPTTDERREGNFSTKDEKKERE